MFIPAPRGEGPGEFIGRLVLVPVIHPSRVRLPPLRRRRRRRRSNYDSLKVAKCLVISLALTARCGSSEAFLFIHAPRGKDPVVFIGQQVLVLVLVIHHSCIDMRMPLLRCCIRQ